MRRADNKKHLFILTEVSRCYYERGYNYKFKTASDDVQYSFHFERCYGLKSFSYLVRVPLISSKTTETT